MRGGVERWWGNGVLSGIEGGGSWGEIQGCYE